MVGGPTAQGVRTPHPSRRGAEANVSASPYPLFLRLEGRRTVLIGAGAVAATKLPALLASGSLLRVVAPWVSPAVRALAGSASIELCEREASEADVEDAWLVVCAAPPAVRRQVKAWTEARRTLLLAVDDVAATDAYAPALLQRAGVTMALGSEGRAPALVGLLRELLELALPPEEELGEWMAAAVKARDAWRAAAQPLASRRRQLLATLCRNHGACPGGAPT